MNSCAAAHRLVAALGMIASVTIALAIGCGDGDSRSGGNGGEGAAPSGGTMTDGGDTSTGGVGGVPMGDGGEAGRGASGGSGADCSEDSDCVPTNACYSANCRAGTCVGSLLTRGSACATGFCNGFGRCLPCLDDAPRIDRDTGCSRALPVCAETSSEPECVGCEEDSECNDGIECTIDRCGESGCERVPVPLGNSCGGGVCNGQADEDSCVPCVDDKNTGFDTGCTTDLPRCDTGQTPAVCSGCELPVDCDDDNECTAERCSGGVCEHATLVSGTPCPRGYCNGISGVELCVPKPCQTDVDCDDRVACTLDACEASSCAYTADHSQCPDSGDVCKPNLCTVGTGCQEVDKSRSLQLLSNGYLDAGNVDWIEMSASYGQVIYEFDYIPTLLPHTAFYVAWLGGGEGKFDDTNSLSQVVGVPPGAVRLELSFFYQIWTEELPDNHNHLVVSLRSTEADPSEGEIVTLYNQDTTRVWTGFTTVIDATDWAGSDIVLELSGTGIDGFTHFFVDTISLVATVCE